MLPLNIQYFSQQQKQNMFYLICANNKTAGLTVNMSFFLLTLFPAIAPVNMWDLFDMLLH